MKFDFINAADDAVDRFELRENRSEILRGLSNLLKEDFESYKRILKDFAESERSEEDYNRLRVAVVGAPLPPKPTANEVVARCLNGQYGHGIQLVVERLKNKGPSKDLMMSSLITLMKPYGFVLSENDITEAIEQL